MYCEIFKSRKLGDSPSAISNRIDLWFSLVLLIAALFLFGINLGGLPLRDWDEGIVAQVARQMSQLPLDSFGWLFPTLAGQPYLNKPPLVHLLIASAYQMVGINEWTTRLPSALLTALSVPLLYGIGLEVFPKRTPAMFSALIYLTLLPIVRHGRLAMLDGPVLCFLLLAIWCLLRSRRDVRFALGMGMGFGLICLTKSILGVLLGAIALIFLAWDTPRLLKSTYLWIGLFLGFAPFIVWCLAQYAYYGDLFVNTNLVDQSFRRIWEPVESRSGPIWYYILEILKYGWPWLLFFPAGYRLAWEHRNASWGKLILVWSSLYLIAISLMKTKLPWYVLPLYPALALAGGAYLTEVWHRLGSPHALKSLSFRSTFFPFLFFLLSALAGWVGFIYFGFIQTPQVDWVLPLMMVSIAIAMTVSAVLFSQADRQFLLILFWGCYVSLLLFVSSNYWVWELGEAYPVKPVAALIRRSTPPGLPIYTSYEYVRPSLDFYSDRHIIPAALPELQQLWNQNQQPYLLLDRLTLQQLDLPELNMIGTAADWTLVTRQSGVEL